MYLALGQPNFFTISKKLICIVLMLNNFLAPSTMRMPLKTGTPMVQSLPKTNNNISVSGHEWENGIRLFEAIF
jgi:hypothetical protein